MDDAKAISKTCILKTIVSWKDETSNIKEFINKERDAS